MRFYPDYKTRFVVLLDYPADNTPACTSIKLCDRTLFKIFAVVFYANQVELAIAKIFVRMFIN